MTDETVPSGDGGESLPEVKAATSDLAQPAEPAAPEVEATPEVTPEAEAKEKEERQRSSTTKYIDRLKTEREALRQQVAELRSKTVAPEPVSQVATGEPTLEQYDYDIAYGRAQAQWAVNNALSAREEAQAKQQAEYAKQDAALKYQEQVDAVSERYADFQEVVGSIDPSFLTPELEAAIIAHPKGAEIAYHIGSHEDDAFQLASTRPELVKAAVDRIAKRLNAPAPSIPAIQPLTKAPAPPPSLSGKAPVAVPAEKLTDEQWLAKERERERKR